MLISLLNSEIDEQTFLNYYNAKIIYKRLPKRIYGFLLKYRDVCLVVINRNLSKENKKRAILHEFAHLELCHLDKCILEFSIENIEDEADMYIENILNYIDEINEEIKKLNLIETC